MSVVLVIPKNRYRGEKESIRLQYTVHVSSLIEKLGQQGKGGSQVGKIGQHGSSKMVGIDLSMQYDTVPSMCATLHRRETGGGSFDLRVSKRRVRGRCVGVSGLRWYQRTKPRD